jgi:hypothetical protein
MTEGFKSTEFWLTIALLLIVVANGPLNLGLDAGELVGAAIGVAGYAGARGVAKLNK